MNNETYKYYTTLINEHSMCPEDWESLVYSDLEDFEVLALIGLARFYDRHE